jgi:hypothetical protein
MTWRTIEVIVLYLFGKLHTDSAVTDEVAGPVEHRFTADPKFLLRAIGIDAAEYEIQEWLPARDLRSALLVPPHSSPSFVIAAFTHKCVDPNSKLSNTGPDTLVKFPVSSVPSTNQAVRPGCDSVLRFRAVRRFVLDRLFQLRLYSPACTTATSSMLWMRVLTSTRSNGLLMKSFAPACNARSL